MENNTWKKVSKTEVTDLFNNAIIDKKVISYLDISGMDLCFLDLPELMADCINAKGTDFSASSLIRISLRDCTLDEANFENCILESADIADCFMEGTVFKKAVLKGAKLAISMCGSACFDDADITKGDLTGTDFDDASFVNACLAGVNAYKASFKRSDLKNANLSGSNLEFADFTGANLEGVIWKGANIKNARFDEDVLAKIKLEIDNDC